MKASRSLVAAATVGLVAAGVVCTNQAGAAPPDKTLLVQGDVASSVKGKSHPVRGAEVRITWIPGLADAQVGDELDIQTLSVAHTDASGRYQVHVAPTEQLKAAAAANGGWISFDVSVATPDGRAQGLSSSRRLAEDGWVQDNPRAGMAGHDGSTTRAAAVAAAPVDWADNQGALDDFDVTFTTPAPPNHSAQSAKAGAKAALIARGRESNEITYSSATTADGTVTAMSGGSVPCSFVTTAMPQRYTRILRMHNAHDSDAHWTYGKSADTDLNVAFDASGDGSWSLRGTHHVGNSDDNNVHAKLDSAYNRYVRTKFQWVEGYYRPYGLGDYCNSDMSIPVWSKRKTATTWLGGVADDTGAGSEFIGCDQYPQNKYRTSYPRGTGFYKGSTTAKRIGLAVDVGPINVGGTSGYSENLDMGWDAVRGNGIWLCGDADHVTGAPRIIHAQNRP